MRDKEDIDREYGNVLGEIQEVKEKLSPYSVIGTDKEMLPLHLYLNSLRQKRDTLKWVLSYTESS